jgi:predicted methyltransferase
MAAREEVGISHTLRFAGSVLIVLLAACAESGPSSTPAATPPAANSAAAAAARSATVDYQALLGAPSRPTADREQDAARKPAETLAFFGVQPGMVVLDLFAGAGYYTELLSAVVGPTGRVVAHTNSAYLSGVGEEWTRRFADSRLPNVEQLMAEGNDIELTPGQFDFVLLSAVYHDVYYVNEARNWPKIDGPRLLAELHAAMKPGATLGLIDHAATPGSAAETGGTLHRIDPAIVKRDFEAAGFVLDAESDLLRNPADDFTKGVFDPAVRGKTDRFMLRFRRP